MKWVLCFKKREPLTTWTAVRNVALVRCTISTLWSENCIWKRWFVHSRWSQTEDFKCFHPNILLKTIKWVKQSCQMIIILKIKHLKIRFKFGPQNFLIRIYIWMQLKIPERLKLYINLYKSSQTFIEFFITKQVCLKTGKPFKKLAQTN